MRKKNLLTVLFVVFICVIIMFGCKEEKQEIKGGALEMKEKKVVLIIASSNFRDEEYLRPKEILTKAGVKIITASTKLGEIKGMLGTKVKSDILIDNINVSDYDGIIFIGGSGADEYWNNKTAHKIAKDAVSQDKILAAICIAPVTLANADVINGKTVTGFYSIKEQLISKGAKYTGKNVEVDNKIITGSGPEAAVLFGKKILELLNK